MAKLIYVMLSKGTISYTNEQGKCYQLKASPAVLIARVRGLHLPEKHVLWQGKPILGACLIFALYFYHNYKTLQAKGQRALFYIPKLQTWQEAKWWSDVFHFTEKRFGLASGTIKATVLVKLYLRYFKWKRSYSI